MPRGAAGGFDYAGIAATAESDFPDPRVSLQLAIAACAVTSMPFGIINGAAARFIG